jgi:hypothetical protein
VFQRRVGQVVDERGLDFVARVERRNLFAAFARNNISSQFYAKVVGTLDKPVRHVYDFDAWHWQTEPMAKICCEHFIGQNPDVLRIVLKLGDVAGAV